jgi:hypothetical protein
MKKDQWIFILTNWASYENVDKSATKVKELSPKFPIRNYDFSIVHDRTNLNSGLYIVFDDWDGFFDLCEKIIDKSKIFILTHTKGVLKYDNLIKKGFGDVKKGQHDPKPAGKYYPEIIEILESGKSEDEVYEGVWNVVFATDKVLERKKELMVLCMCEDWINTNWATIKSNQHYPKVKDFIEKMAGTRYRDAVYQENYLEMARVLDSDNAD